MSGCLFRIQFADGHVEERELGDGRFQIGREQGAIVLRDPKSSAVHGELVIQGAAVTYTDLGSSNGSFDAHGRRLTEPARLSPGQSVQLGNSALTFLRRPGAANLPAANLPAANLPTAQLAAAGLAPTQAMAAVEAAPAGLRSASPAPAPHGAGSADNQARAGSGGGFSHPNAEVRHSYPLSISSASIGESLKLLLEILPFLLVRFGILCALTLASILYLAVVIGGALLLSKAAAALAWIWVIGLLAVGGSLWRFVVRYMLYVIKLGHIAVLTELITTGNIANGTLGMFEYGKRVVTERFGEVNVMFALGLLISGIVGAFNRTLNWVASLLPVPGLDSLMGVVNAVLRASTTYIDETVFSYNLARGDENVFRSSKDGLIYYAQNAREVLKTGLWVVVLDAVLTGAIWVVMLLPGLALSYLMPGRPGGIVMIVIAVLFAGSVRSAFLKPLFLTMVMVKFHAAVRNQPINLDWDQRLGSASRKFEELKQQAETWVRPGRGPQPGAAQAA